MSAIARSTAAGVSSEKRDRGRRGNLSVSLSPDQSPQVQQGSSRVVMKFVKVRVVQDPKCLTRRAYTIKLRIRIIFRFNLCL